MLDKVWDEFLGNVLFVTEFTVEGDWEASVLHTLVDAGVEDEGGEREHGRGADLSLTLDGFIVE